MSRSGQKKICFSNMIFQNITICRYTLDNCNKESCNDPIVAKNTDAGL